MSEIIIGVGFNRETLTIELRSGEKLHEIDLDDCIDSAQLLGALFHLSHTHSFSSLLPEVYLCLEEACELVFGRSAQGVYCPHGIDHVVSWRDATSVAKGTKPRAVKAKKLKGAADRTKRVMSPAQIKASKLMGP